MIILIVFEIRENPMMRQERLMKKINTVNQEILDKFKKFKFNLQLLNFNKISLIIIYV